MGVRMEAMKGRSSKAPPRSTEPTSSPKPNEQSKEKLPVGKREEGLNGLGDLAVFGCIMARQLADAGAIAQHKEPISHEIALLCEQDERIGKWVDTAVAIGPYAGIIGAVLPLAAQLAVNHKAMPAEAGAMLGVVHPQALEANMKAKLAEQALEAMRQQAEAEKRLMDVAEQMQGGQPTE